MAERIVTVTAGSRLHFGMLSFGQRGQPQYGGAGAMISAPALRLSIRESDRFEAIGPLKERVERFVTDVSRQAAWRPEAWRAGLPRVRITVESAPPQHAGLGSGTQLGMALARGLAALVGAEPQTAESLARAAGRGKRSAVGIYGACLGGLIAESGKLGAEEISPLLQRVALPDAWRFALFVPADCPGLSGEAEQRAFDRLPPVPLTTTAALLRELTSELLPSASEGDFDRFSAALDRYGRLAGQCFAAQQGGVFASAAIERLVERCRTLGVRGVGQSSWGPTVFALCRADEEAERLVSSLRAAGELDRASALITPPDNRGLLVEHASA